MRLSFVNIIFLGGLLTTISSSGCREEEPECIPSGKVNVVEVEKTPLRVNRMDPARKDKDHCQACVLSKSGFFSCQMAIQAKDEPRAVLKKKAKELACKDAGYAVDQCPHSAVTLLQCKGDAPPAKETKLTKAFRGMMEKATGRKVSGPESSSKPTDSNNDASSGEPTSPESAPMNPTQPVLE